MSNWVRSLRFLRPALVLLAAGLVGCGTLREVREVATPSVSGEILLRAAAGEPLSWKPDSCFNGEREQFFGFVLGASGSPLILRAVLDPLDGPGLRLTGLEGTPPRGIVVRQADCRALSLSVQPTGWTVNDFRDVSGTLEVSCTLGDGVSFEGSLAISHCH
jgi:hypothetical protein